MAAEAPEELLVTIVPPRAPLGRTAPPDLPWLGPLVIIGAPVALAVATFVLFFVD